MHPPVQALVQQTLSTQVSPLAHWFG